MRLLLSFLIFFCSSLTYSYPGHFLIHVRTYDGENPLSFGVSGRTTVGEAWNGLVIFVYNAEWIE